MQREPTVPIGIWGPALLAAIVVLVCWGGRSGAPKKAGVEPISASVPEAAPAPAEQSDPSAPAGNAVTPAANDLPPAIKTGSGSEPPPANESPSETEPPRTETSPPAAPVDSPAPESVPESDPAAVLADPVLPVSPSDFPAGWVALGGERSRRRSSGATLAPLVVIVSEDRPDLARAIAAFSARLRARVLEPAKLVLPNPSDSIVEIDFSGGDPPSEPRDSIDALGEAWLGQLFDGRGRRRPPAWWCEGAIESARGESLQDVLQAPAARAPLARVFARGALRDDDVRATAGSFAAFCLSAPPGDHLHATWLEFAGPSLAPNENDRDVGSEIAARFGFTRLAELEALWEAARGR